jgi:protein gp37
MTTIEWTDATWNPVRGCSRVSAGCDHCYAMGQAHRFSGPYQPYEGLTVLRPKTAKRPGVDWSGVARLAPGMLEQPLKWRKPRRVFVNSMSDLFHPSLPFPEIAAVFGVMAATPRHTFQVLTKRPERAREFFNWLIQLERAELSCLSVATRIRYRIGGHARTYSGRLDALHPERGPEDWPLPNVWLGVSVEDQATADERIPLLLECPAALHFVSYEPALGPVDFTPFLHDSDCLEFKSVGPRELCICSEPREDHLDWVIVGGESGNSARPFDVQWARSTVEQCRAAGVACFVKQLGGRPKFDQTEGYARVIRGDAVTFKDKKGGDWDEWPEDLRVREFPKVAP